MNKKWFIIIIVGVFDPLAVCLVIAYNSISNKEEIKIHPIIKQPIKIVGDIYKNLYKRGTKKAHNPDLADPSIN